MANLMKYLSKACTACGAANNWEESVREAGKLLLAAGHIDESYIERCVETVKTEGPYMVLTKGIALAHTRPGEDVHAEAISVLSLETPVEFGHKDNDPVKVVFLLAALDNNSHINVLMELAQKLSEPGIREALQESSNADEIYEMLVK